MQDKQKYRGKLYSLSEESAWQDTGTGHVQITGSEENADRRLVFRDEESDSVVHDRPVFGKDVYQLQGEGERQTIIVWEDAETQKDWALSFQDPDGTTEVWDALTKDPSGAGLLPLPKFGNLAELHRLLTCVPPSQREPLANECMAPKFIAGLREAFHTAEDLGDAEALQSVYGIAKGVFLLSNQKCTERFLQRDVYEDIMGMLEYDDGLSDDNRIAHRQVLQIKVKFQDVVSFEDEQTLERVHLNYRLQYLKDIALPRILDDHSFASLTQMIHGNLSIILDHIQKSASILDRLFAQIQQKDLNAVQFLQDLCRLAKVISPGERQALHEKMNAGRGRVFEVLAPYLADRSEYRCDAESKTTHPPRHLAIEVLILSSQNDPSQLRRFLTSEGNATGRQMLADLIHLMHVEADQGAQGQISEMLKSVMDPTALEHRERDSSLDVFYDRGALDELSVPLRADAATPSSSSQSFCFAQQLVCELLAFAVAHHGYRARVYVMRHGLAQQAGRLLASPQRFLQLAPVRFIRAMIMTKDDAYHRYIIKSGLFGPLMRNLQISLAPPALGGNLIVSATLELIEFIRVQNIKSLVDHICRKHGPMLQEYAPKLKTFEGLLLKHQQNLEYEAFPPEQHAAGGPIAQQSAPTGGRGPSRVLRSPGRDSDDDDEAYFETLDDDDEGAEGGSDGSGGGISVLEAPYAGGVGSSAQPKDGNGSAGLKGLLGGYDDDDSEENDKESKVDGDGTTPPLTAPSDDAPAGLSDETPAEPISDMGAGTVEPVEDAAVVPGVNGNAEDPPADETGGQAEGMAESMEADKAPATSEEIGDSDGIGGDGIVSEKALNHVPKRLKTTAA